MKRSEFIVRVNSARDPMAEAAVAAAEAAGVTWDPEEEPLPEHLWITTETLSSDHGVIAVDKQLDDSGNYMFCTMARWRNKTAGRVLIEAVRRYNATPQAAKMIRAASDHGIGSGLRAQLLAILDGREPAS